MRKNRKMINLEAEYVDAIKEIARRRGLSISSYIRQLLDEALRVESMGYYAPRALMERWIELLLVKAGFTYIHPDILTVEDLGVIEEKGVKLGRVLSELGADAMKIIELLGSEAGVAVVQGSSIILLPQEDKIKSKMLSLIKGVARGAGLTVSVSGSLTIISASRRSLL
ncbi:MAG: ribbon-helix-helix protein, CopG family [Desulfurococcus sp.]|nr:ribbon-helix-helix protein, CopG family [Desulfurococcus sp.]